MRSALLTLACAAFAAPAVAQNDAGGEQTAPLTADEQVDALIKEYESLRQEFWSTVRAAETEEERDKLREQGGPDVAAFAARFFEVAEANVGSEGALSALSWIVDNSEDAANKDKALSLIVSQHIESESLKDVCSSLGRELGSSSTAALERMLSDSPHQEVKGHACYSLARQASSLAKIAGKLQEKEPDENYINWYTRQIGEARMAELGKAGPKEFRLRAEKLYERLGAEFGDVKTRRGTLGERAQSNLFEIRNLQIGMIAPDIEGADLNGVNFKLSDYRGKVVVLDFWGNW